jgi:hypothetical protein
MAGAVNRAGIGPLLAASLFLMSPIAAVGQCNCPKTVTLDAWGLYSYSLSHDLPPVRVVATKSQSAVPTVAKIVVSPDGAPCSFDVLSTSDPDLVTHLQKAVMKWRFRAPVLADAKQSSPLCMRSKIYVYAKRQGDHISWEGPGLTKPGAR